MFVLVLVIAVVTASYYAIEPNKQYIQTVDNVSPTHVGLVLGAGLAKNGQPYDELKSRLDVAAQAMKAGKVNVLILSGDNRYADYNEPAAMRDYLVREHGLDPNNLVPDYAGRSTYESCERAKKIFGAQQLIIFSAGSHLPRAIYLCSRFGVAATGVPSTVEANNSTRRELLARVKAVYNVHFRGEPTVLGDPIQLP